MFHKNAADVSKKIPCTVVRLCGVPCMLLVRISVDTTWCITGRFALLWCPFVMSALATMVATAKWLCFDSSRHSGLDKACCHVCQQVGKTVVDTAVCIGVHPAETIGTPDTVGTPETGITMSINDLKKDLARLLGKTAGQNTADKALQKAAQAPVATAKENDVKNFLSQLNRVPPANVQGKGGRLIFALDATASREATWDQAMQLQAEMFASAQSLGGLQVQLAYFRGMAEFRASDWLLDSGQLLGLMTGIRCQAGITKIEQLLLHTLRETRRQKVHALVYIGDCVEENKDLLCQKAGELGMLNVPLFVFQEGYDGNAQRCFKEMARLSGGAWAPFDHGSADQLRDLLKAVAVYASGGLKALQDYSRHAHPGVALLGSQLKR